MYMYNCKFSFCRQWLSLLIEKGAKYDFLCDFPIPDYPGFDCISKATPDYFTTASSYRISPLILAINGFHFEMSKYLLQNGASCNFADSQGLTPLMHAVKKVSLFSFYEYCDEWLKIFFLRKHSDM